MVQRNAWDATGFRIVTMSIGIVMPHLVDIFAFTRLLTYLIEVEKNSPGLGVKLEFTAIDEHERA